MVRIGSKAGSAGNIKDRATRQNKQWLARIGKDDLRVRILQEPEEWTEFQEHYTKKYNFTPCGQEYGLDCPPCDSLNDQESKRSTRYVINALDVKQGKVVALKIPLTLANKLTERFERRGTVTDRDYTLMKIGSGLDTDYDLEAEERTAVDLDRYKSDLHDIPDLLGSIYEEAFGTPKTIGSGKAPEEPKEKQGWPEPDLSMPKPPKEPEGDFISEDDMRKMTLPELEAIAKQVGVEVQKDWDQDDYIEAIIAKGNETD